jgi:copper chaperone CopZ
VTTDTSTLELTISGMHCGSCALLIDDVLADLPGVLTSTTSSKTQRSIVTHDNRATPGEITAAIAELGYSATAATD